MKSLFCLCQIIKKIPASKPIEFSGILFGPLGWRHIYQYGVAGLCTSKFVSFDVQVETFFF